MLGTVINVGRVLDLYDADHPELGPTQVGEALGMTKSRAHLLLASMTEIGLLRRNPGGRYCVGWRSLSLERLAMGNAPFRPLARAMALRLARHTGEMIHVAALERGGVVYLDRVPGRQAVEIPVSQVGAHLPAHCSGVGKALLAHLDPAGIDAILDRAGLPRLTPATICDRDALHGELHRIRRDGVAVDREEVQAGLSCVAAPLTDREGEVVAAISISMPTSRFARHEAAYANLIVRAAAEISQQTRRMTVDDFPLSDVVNT